MKLTRLTIIFAAFLFNNASAQKISAKPKSWTAFNSEVSYNKGVIHLTNEGSGSALLWINDLDFENGFVELDIRGKDENGNSFLGLAFHGKDSANYEALYFRPFNFKNDQKKGNSIQYISSPDYQWDNLREMFPGKYENEISPVPDPNEWFHVKIEIDYPWITVYINGSSSPTIQVEQISKRKQGKIGLWLDSDEGYFKNVSVNNSNN